MQTDNKEIVIKKYIYCTKALCDTKSWMPIYKVIYALNYTKYIIYIINYEIM